MDFELRYSIYRGDKGDFDIFCTISLDFSVSLTLGVVDGKGFSASILWQWKVS